MIRSLYESPLEWPLAPSPFSRRGVRSVVGIEASGGEAKQMGGGGGGNDSGLEVGAY